MDFIEQILGIENRWAILGILVGLQVLLCISVNKITKKEGAGWLTLILTFFFVVAYLWKFPWWFLIVGGIISLWAGCVSTTMTFPEKGIQVPQSPVSSTPLSSPASSSASSSSISDPLGLSFGTQSYHNSLKGHTVQINGIMQAGDYILFLCREILGVDYANLHSDFNDDLGADDMDFDTFIGHMQNEVWFPDYMGPRIRNWYKNQLDIIRRNRERGIYNSLSGRWKTFWMHSGPSNPLKSSIRNNG